MLAATAKGIKGDLFLDKEEEFERFGRSRHPDMPATRLLGQRLDECIIRSGTGSRDADIYYEWAPLRGMSAKEKADVFKTRRCAPVGGYFAGSGNYSREAVSDALVNALVEDGTLPGLVAAIEEYRQAERAGARRRRACGRSSRTVESRSDEPARLIKRPRISP